MTTKNQKKGDICSKFDRLCSQICENTDDSYICKCENGYQLLEDKITCVPMKNNITLENNDVLSSDNVNGDSTEKHINRDSKLSGLPTSGSGSQTINNE